MKIEGATVNKERIKEIHKLLPKLNCGFCGFGNCGQFARAVAEGRASPFGCRQNPWSGYQISEIMGIKLPAYSPFAIYSRPADLSPKALKEEVKGLFRNVDDVLARIENLKVSR